MFIQTEATPNPATIKFLPGLVVMTSGTADFRSAESAHHSPLAQRLFTLDGVSGVFLGRDFISVTKQDGKDWTGLKTRILQSIMEHFTLGLPVILASSETANPESENDSEIVQQIKELIETRVRPLVAMDGGDIVFDRFDDGIVYLHMRGACAGCPSSSATLKSGIENMLKHFVPEVRAVEPAAA
jgi:Fe-S cluster biogenesis protein NfuA